VARRENVKATCGHGVRWSWDRMCWGYTVILGDPESFHPAPVCLCRYCLDEAVKEKKVQRIIIHHELVKPGDLDESDT